MIVNLFIGLSLGSNVVIANAIGRRDESAIEKTVHTSIVIAVLGGVLVALFAWPEGWSRMLWSLGVVVLVQQLEGGMLSPQLMSETTRLHPIVVLLCVMAGGAAGGVAGVLLAIPAVLCVRAALRVIQLKRLEEQFEET